MHDDIVSNVRENLHYLDVSMFNHILSGSIFMYTMKEVCQIVGWSYETLKYYCKEGLIPNVKRDKNNYRVFDENNIEWIKGLQCLKKCGMSLKDMRMYLDYCMQGPASIPERVDMLNETKEDLERRLSEIQESLDYIEQKKELYRDMQEGKKPYVSYVYHVEN